MLKKLIHVMLVLVIFAVQAHAATHSGLKAAFDEMNYALAVEWDQKDRAFYDAQMKKFMGQVRELQRQGLTNAQMIEFAKSEIKDQKMAKDLETAFSMITINKMSSEEASQFMIESMKRAYSSGASWTGDVLIYLAVGILIVALAVSLAGGTASGSTGGGAYCYDDCYYYSYQCGWDFWGPIYCERYTCDTICY
jgi:hypothetical protein